MRQRVKPKVLISSFTFIPANGPLICTENFQKDFTWSPKDMLQLIQTTIITGLISRKVLLVSPHIRFQTKQNSHTGQLFFKRNGKRNRPGHLCLAVISLPEPCRETVHLYQPKFKMDFHRQASKKLTSSVLAPESAMLILLL